MESTRWRKEKELNWNAKRLEIQNLRLTGHVRFVEARNATGYSHIKHLHRMVHCYRWVNKRSTVMNSSFHQFQEMMQECTRAPRQMESALRHQQPSIFKFCVSFFVIYKWLVIRETLDFHKNESEFCKNRFILDPPEIELETDRVHSGVNKEAHLTCKVQGNPAPRVNLLEEIN